MTAYIGNAVEDLVCFNYDRLGLGGMMDRLLAGVPAAGGQPKLSRILTAMRSKGYKVFTGSKGLDLNIVGIRSSSRKAGQFDDWITVFWTTGTGWEFHAYPATTDPGTKYLTKPLRSVRHKGTAILKPGQYRSAYKIGKHRGKYMALVQAGKVTVYRDNDRDSFLDMGGSQQTGHYGINIHRAHWKEVLQEVGGHSAGCQVFQDPRDFATFMGYVKKSAKTYGNRFTYTLLDEQADLSR